MAQVWLRIYDLPLQYRKARTLLNIASRVGFPLKIDPATLSLDIGIYARVLIDVDLSRSLPKRLLVKNKKKNFEFFLYNVDYEKLPVFCYHCG